MNAFYKYNKYKRHIKHDWYTDLGGKEMLRTGGSSTKNLDTSIGDMKLFQCHIQYLGSIDCWKYNVNILLYYDYISKYF